MIKNNFQISKKNTNNHVINLKMKNIRSNITNHLKKSFKI
jgi:hypothetical protein